MSKAQLVVLGFLHQQPMHGYQIGHVVEKHNIPVWAGIKLPSIYKAMQSLQEKRFIRGEQKTEGNNPPRTVFHITPKGVDFLRKLLEQYLTNPAAESKGFWLAMSFTAQAVGRQTLLNVVEQRIAKLRSICRNKPTSECHKMPLHFIHKHLIKLGDRCNRIELKTLDEIKEDILIGNVAGFFLAEGDDESKGVKG